MRRRIALVALLSASLLAPAARGHVVAGQRCAVEQRLGDAELAYAASARGTVKAVTAPGGGLVRTFLRKNQNGVRTVFGVVASVTDASCKPAWYRVQLPMRPNGAVGYVRADDVNLFLVRSRVEVDLSFRRVSVFRRGRRVLTAPAGIGFAGTPTPTGRYYVNQRFRLRDPSGPFGSAAIGVSAFSPTLTGWAQGGPIAIHGTNDPSSVGRAASHGCIRVQNNVARRLLRLVGTGSPVLIHA
jgi:L,D-transpeptidase-like protein